MDNYLTLKGSSSDEFIVKHSRFIGYASPVKTKDEAVDFINSIRAKHWDATHNVYAYVLRDSNQQRYSDDGEPQGTAGIPVLDVIKKEGITDCVVVVTRYFGGILLGGGGLVRAYTLGAKIAVDAAGIIEMKRRFIAQTQCDYTYYGKVSSLIPAYGGAVVSADFGVSVDVSFTIPCDEYDKFLSDLTDSCFGKVSCTVTGETFSGI